jgi:hypothetical protein
VVREINSEDFLRLCLVGFMRQCGESGIFREFAWERISSYYDEGVESDEVDGPSGWRTKGLLSR